MAIKGQRGKRHRLTASKGLPQNRRIRAADAWEQFNAQEFGPLKNGSCGPPMSDAADRADRIPGGAPHWHYHCWQTRFAWEERVAMSELGIGPEDVSQNRNRRVQSVSLWGRDIPDERLVHLKAFSELSSLNLDRSTVTDACVPYLLSLPSLRTLRIVGTRISRKAIKRLERSNPDLLVFHKRGEAAVQDPGGRWVKTTWGLLGTTAVQLHVLLVMMFIALVVFLLGSLLRVVFGP